MALPRRWVSKTQRPKRLRSLLKQPNQRLLLKQHLQRDLNQRSTQPRNLDYSPNLIRSRSKLMLLKRKPKSSSRKALMPKLSGCTRTPQRSLKSHTKTLACSRERSPSKRQLSLETSLSVLERMIRIDSRSTGVPRLLSDHHMSMISISLSKHTLEEVLPMRALKSTSWLSTIWSEFVSSNHRTSRLSKVPIDARSILNRTKVQTTYHLMKISQCLPLNQLPKLQRLLNQWLKSQMVLLQQHLQPKKSQRSKKLKRRLNLSRLQSLNPRHPQLLLKLKKR